MTNKTSENYSMSQVSQVAEQAGHWIFLQHTLNLLENRILPWSFLSNFWGSLRAPQMPWVEQLPQLPHWQAVGLGRPQFQLSSLLEFKKNRCLYLLHLQMRHI